MPYCPNCGMEFVPSERFCLQCGKQLPQTPLQIDSEKVQSSADLQGQNLERKISWVQDLEKIVKIDTPKKPSNPRGTPVKTPVDPTSRVAHTGMVKFLFPGEKIIFRTKSQVRLGNQKRIAYVTNKRLILYYQEPVLLGLVRNDRMDDFNLEMIQRFSISEEGLISKRIILKIDEVTITGDRGDVIELYNTIRQTRGSY
jgi:hypothetical protein